MQMEENGNAGKRSRLIYADDKDACFEKKTTMAASNAGCSFRQWQLPSSRIFRVSRASGSKDRHSKVLTFRGLRDRRVRLSVSTAIQFYDLQDRLGYDQPSKAIEWLIKAASAAIDELPSLGSSFAELPSPSGEQNRASGCSSTSETSKSSVLSLSRSEICVEANHPDCSFTKLLTDHSASVSDAAAVLPSHSHYLNGCPMLEMAVTGDHLEMQQISFMQDHMDYNLNFAIGSGLACFQRGTLQSNSSVHLTQQQHFHNNLLLFPSPSSSSSSSSMVGQNLHLVAPALAASSAENLFCSGLDGRLQLSREPPAPFLLDGYRASDLKGKGKN